MWWVSCDKNGRVDQIALLKLMESARWRWCGEKKCLEVAEDCDLLVEKMSEGEHKRGEVGSEGKVKEMEEGRESKGVKGGQKG